MSTDQPAEGAWGPECCGRCGGPLPRGLVVLGRTAHVDCEEAREAWKALSAAGRPPVAPARG